MAYALIASMAGKFATRFKNIMETNNVTGPVTFVVTAANFYEDKSFMENDIAAFEAVGMVVNRIDFAELEPSEAIKSLLQSQVLFVGGGNPIYLLEVLQDKKLMEPIKERIEQGMFYVGSSAGAVMAGPDLELEVIFEDRESVVLRETYAGLNLCPVYPMPHWGASKMQQLYTTYTDAAYSKELPIIGLNDDQALEIVDGKMQLISIA